MGWVIPGRQRKSERSRPGDPVADPALLRLYRLSGDGDPLLSLAGWAELWPRLWDYTVRTDLLGWVRDQPQTPPLLRDQISALLQKADPGRPGTPFSP